MQTRRSQSTNRNSNDAVELDQASQQQPLTDPASTLQGSNDTVGSDQISQVTSTVQNGNDVVKLDEPSQQLTTDSDLERSPMHQNPSGAHSLKDSTPKTLRARALNPFGRWWEFGAIAVSLLSMSLIAAILVAMNGKSLVAWKLPMQINSMIALCSTIARSASLPILAEGLSQLKWNHFEKGASTMDRLQAFDDASRGPWGAVMVFVKMKWELRSLPAIGAFLTILALAFEPFTQQILKFPSRRVVVGNGTAYVSAAEEFALPELSSNSKQGLSIRLEFTYIGDILYITGGPKLIILQSIIDLLPNPSAGTKLHFQCPAGDCELPAHWSLATCVDCEKSFLDQDALQCFYYIYRNNKIESASLEDFKRISIADGVSDYSRKLDELGIVAYCEQLRSWHGGKILKSKDTMKWYITTPFKFSKWNDPYLTEEQTNYTSDSLIIIQSTKFASGFPKFEDLGQWSGITENMTRCKLKYCVKETAATVFKNGHIQTNDSEDELLPLTFSNPCGTNPTCPNVTTTFRRHTGETRTIQMSTDVRVGFGNIVIEMLDGVFQMPMAEMYLNGLEAPDIAELMSTVASFFTRSSQNARSKNLTGSAYSIETYVYIR